MLVALRRFGIGSRAYHRGGAGRDDHRRGRVRLARSDGAIGRFAVIGAIRRDRGDGASDLIEQGANRGGIALIRGGQLRGKDLTAVRVDREVALAPDPMATFTMLFGQPFAGAVYLQAG